jgi:hypothetical protein
MESVHFYEKKIEKNVLNILNNDDFMRISRIIRESDAFHDGKEGCILYINASQNEINDIVKKLKDIGAEKITGDEEKIIIDSFKKEEENAASGIGLMFS